MVWNDDSYATDMRGAMGVNDDREVAGLVVVGCQAGDEGKGKVTDLLCDEGVTAVARFQGGPHTGHTVVTADGEFRFVQIPAGVLRGPVGVLGNGCVVEPRMLIDELAALRRRVPRVRLLISEICHVVMPYHRLQDEAAERWRGNTVSTGPASGSGVGTGRIGSTRQGVGPCREDKIARIGLRLVDLLDEDSLRARLALLLPLKRRLLAAVYDLPLDDHGELFDVATMTRRYWQYGQQLSPYLADVSAYLSTVRAGGGRVVYEGAQGAGLDVEHGTYPYCSSGYSAAGGLPVGTGSPPTLPLTVVGVCKAYMSRVGGGPMPTELSGRTADAIVERGREFGTVTGRRRRIGWLDLAFLRRATRTDGVRHLFVSNVDVLAGLDEVKVATHYLIDGERVDEYPARLRRAAKAEPVYRTFAGWPDQDWADVARRGYAAVPAAARQYLEWVADAVGVDLGGIGVGPSRNHTILLGLR